MKILGIHHITAISSDAQTNIDFYSSLLGLRLIKVTVNFDDPGTYHLYYGDANGKPGSALTFFIWPSAHRGTAGTSHVISTSFAVPDGSLAFWQKRLDEGLVPVEKIDAGLRFRDPDGMHLEICEHKVIDEFAFWDGAGVPQEHAIRGFAGATLAAPRLARTSTLLTSTMGLTQSDKTSYGFEESKAFIKLDESVVNPSSLGAGIVHHIAFRVANDEDQAAWLEKINTIGLASSPIMDRSYFHSVYFRDPSGVLFELATDRPGFEIDEAKDKLGTTLCLPPWMEERRGDISKNLPKLLVSQGRTMP